VARSTADTVERPGGRKEVVVLGSAASLIEGTDKSSSAINGIALSTVRIAVAVAAAGTLARIRSTSLEALLVAVAGLVAGGADVSAHEALVGRESGVDSSLHDLVDLGTEAKLLVNSNTVLLGASLLQAHLSKSKRDVVLRNVESGLLTKAVASLAKSVSDRGGDAEELLHGQLLHISITVLAGLGGVLGELPSISKELVEGDGGRILLIHGTDPATRPAGGDEGAESVIVPAGIGRVISGSRGGDVNIVRDVLLVEHGARVASLDEDDPVLVVVLGAENVKEILDILTASETTAIRHGNDVSVAVVIIVEEDVILLSGLEGLAASGAGSHASKNSDKVISSGVLASVILRDARIDVNVVTTLDVEIVVDFTREGVAGRLGNIISHEDNDTLIRNTILVSNLISMADRCLMPVVAISGRTSSKNNPGVLGIGGRTLLGKSLL